MSAGLPDDAALSAALGIAFPKGVRLVQATPDLKKGDGRFTLRLEPAADGTKAAAVEALLLPPGEFERARSDYEEIDAEFIADDDLGLLLPLGGADRRLPALAGFLAPGGPWRLVRHRLERRAVLARDDEGLHAKIHRSAARAAAAARNLEIAAGSGVAVPKVRFVDANDAIVLTETLEGRTLLDRLSDDESDERAALAGAAVARLAASPVRREIEDRHGLEDEIRVVAAWREKLASLAPRAADAIAPVFERAAARARALPSTEPVPSHRDFYDKQVLARDGGVAVAIVDWDSLALSDPALDAANFVAHLRLRTLQGLVDAGRAGDLRAKFLSGRKLGAQESERLAPLEALTLLRLASLYALRPPWAHLTPRIVRAAEEALA